MALSQNLKAMPLDVVAEGKLLFCILLSIVAGSFLAPRVKSYINNRVLE